jgi:hypothetical protein
MQGLLLVMFCCITLVDFSVSKFGLPPSLRLIPEVISVILIFCVLPLGIQQKFRLVSPKYWLIFGALAIVIVAGIVTNNDGPGPILAGLRYYLRAFPLFFLSAVFTFTEQQLRGQLKLLLVLGLLQVPITCYQRWLVWIAERWSGDSVSGTLMDSGVLSIFLICSVLVLTGLFLRGRVSKLVFFSLFFILLFPTTINETKVTVVILPIGLLTVFLIGSPPGKRLLVAGWATVLLAAFGAIFVPIYDYMDRNDPYKREIVDFFSDQKQLDAYMEKRSGGGVGAKTEAGRVDTIVVPLHYLEHDAVRLAFGLGVGNASHSNLGQSFTGRYYDLFQRFVYTSMAVFMLEIGIFGTVLVVLLNWMLLADTLAVARADGTLTGSIAIGWTGVVIIVSIALTYNVVESAESISYVYWYISGLIAARRMQMAIAGVSGGTKLPAHPTALPEKPRRERLASNRRKIASRAAGRTHSSL